MTGAYAILNIYCGLVDNNIVVDIENNFDQSSGTVIIYEGVLVGSENEGIIVVGGTFIDKRTQDEEKFSVIYYSNYNESQDYFYCCYRRSKLKLSIGVMYDRTIY